jgi:hypothetical protein
VIHLSLERARVDVGLFAEFTASGLRALTLAILRESKTTPDSIERELLASGLRA